MADVDVDVLLIDLFLELILQKILILYQFPFALSLVIIVLDHFLGLFLVFLERFGHVVGNGGEVGEFFNIIGVLLFSLFFYGRFPKY